MDPQITTYIIKLVLGGIVSFLSILVMSKTRDTSWMMIVIGFLCLYATLVYELMIELGIFATPSLLIAGIPVSTLICTVVPNIFFILAFILRIARK